MAAVSFHLFFFMLAAPASLHLFPAVSSTEFGVGGTTPGWAIPDANNSRFYNLWASKNRFLVGDILIFKYKKDSVMVVSEDGYKQCNATQPIFFSNTGYSKVVLERPGLHYFISGATGHCELGQKMIIKVMDLAPNASPANSTDSSGAAVLSITSSAMMIILAPIATFSLGVCF